MLLKVLIFSFLSFAYGLNNLPDNCEFRFDYKVSGPTDGFYSVAVKPEKSVSATFTLVDLYSGKTVGEHQATLNASQETVVFSKIPASLYTISYLPSNCKQRRTIGGIQGIKVGIE